MKSIFGEAVQFCLFGESHSAAVGVVINGLAPGILLDWANLKAQLARRRAKGRISTGRREPDEPHIVSGLFEGRTTGAPLCLLIENTNTKSADYAQFQRFPRPSHADYAAGEKYLGAQDWRGGGHFSGRLTAPLAAAGAICGQILRAKGIAIGTHIRSLAAIEDAPFPEGEPALARAIASLGEREFPTLDGEAGARMIAAIEKGAAQGDSLGGVAETAVAGMPAGIGEPFFSSVESKLSQLLYSVPAVKGVEFGAGFALANLPGSAANDPFVWENGRVRTRTNHNGGLNGGVSNGMPLLFRTAVKPTASIYLEQDTVDLRDKVPARLKIEGRHDPCILHRAVPVFDAVTAMALLDLLSERYGYLWQKAE